MKAQTEWVFAFWKNRPAIWSEVAAFSFEKGEWSAASFADVGTDGRSRTRASLEIEFGDLQNIPPFPSEEAAAALQIEERRLQRI